MISEKRWFQEQRLKLDHIDWMISREESDPLYQDKMDRVLGFYEKNGIGTTDRKEFYSRIEKMHDFLSGYQGFSLPKFLNFNIRLN